MADASIEFIRDLIRERLGEKIIDIDTAQILFFLLAEIEGIKKGC